MSRHKTEIQYTDTDHRFGVLYDPRDPGVYVNFTVSRMLTHVTFRHNGAADRWSTQTWIGAARRLLGSTGGIVFGKSSNLMGGHSTLITVRRGAK